MHVGVSDTRTRIPPYHNVQGIKYGWSATLSQSIKNWFILHPHAKPTLLYVSQT